MQATTILLLLLLLIVTAVETRGQGSKGAASFAVAASPDARGRRSEVPESKLANTEWTDDRFVDENVESEQLE